METVVFYVNQMPNNFRNPCFAFLFFYFFEFFWWSESNDEAAIIFLATNIERDLNMYT